MNRFFAYLFSLMIFGVCPLSQATEILAYIPATTTAGGTFPSFVNGISGPSHYFDMIFFSAVNLDPVANSSYAQFSGLPNTADGDPSATYFEIAFVRNVAYFNVDIRFEVWYVAPGKTGIGPSMQLFSYSSVGGFTSGTTNQMTAGGTGLNVTNTTPSTTATSQNYDTTTLANRTMPSGLTTYQIRIALTVAGNANLLLGGFSTTVENFTASNAMFVFVGVPEPSTYVLSAVGFGTLAIIGRRRRRQTERSASA